MDTTDYPALSGFNEYLIRKSFLYKNNRLLQKVNFSFAVCRFLQVFWERSRYRYHIGHQEVN